MASNKEGYFSEAKLAPVPSVVAEYSYWISRHLSWHTYRDIVGWQQHRAVEEGVSIQLLRYIKTKLVSNEVATTPQLHKMIDRGSFHVQSSAVAKTAANMTDKNVFIAQTGST